MSKPAENPYDRSVHPYVDDDTWKKRLYSNYPTNQSVRFTEAERNLIVLFISEKIAVDGIKAARRVKIVTMLSTFRRFLPCEYHKLNSSQWQKTVVEFNSSKLSDNTKHDAVVVVKAFLRYLFDNELLPNLSEKNISRVRPVDSPKVTKTPEELPTPEEIHKITTNPTCTVMFAAFINTLYYTGMRSSECLKLNWNDILFDKNMVKIRIWDSKESNYRYAPCVEAKTYLANWRRHYPVGIVGGPTGDNPVWITESQTDKGVFRRLQYDRAREWFVDMQARCGIPGNGKPHYCFHACRAAHITNCALSGMSDAVNKEIHWANQGTEMMRRYCLLSNDSVERAVLAMAGIEEEKHKVNHGVVLCPACSAPNGPNDLFCHYCGAPLTAAAAAKQNDVWDKFTAAGSSEIDIIGLLANQLNVDITSLKRKLLDNM